MIAKFRGICLGTETKHSERKNVDYSVTKFIDMETKKVLEVFGDLGLPASLTPQDWELKGDITGMQNVSVVAGAVAQKKS